MATAKVKLPNILYVDSPAVQEHMNSLPKLFVVCKKNGEWTVLTLPYSFMGGDGIPRVYKVYEQCAEPHYMLYRVDQVMQNVACWNFKDTYAQAIAEGLKLLEAKRNEQNIK